MRNVKVSASGKEMKVKVFQENDIIEKLGRTKEDWQLVRKYQKEFWQLLQNDEGFCVDARMLWEKLNEPTGRFDIWIDRKLVNKNIREDGNKKKTIPLYVESVDFATMYNVVHREIGGSKRKDFMLTIDCAKNVCLMEETKSAQLVRDYFILMEKIIREYEEWTNIRQPQKEGDKTMKATLKTIYENQTGKSPSTYDYSNESDMLNIALTTMKAGKLREYLDMRDKNTRDHLTSKVNQALAQLQFLNTSLINSSMKFKQRKTIIQNTVETNYKDIKLEIDKVKQNKVF